MQEYRQPLNRTKSQRLWKIHQERQGELITLEEWLNTCTPKNFHEVEALKN